MNTDTPSTQTVTSTLDHLVVLAPTLAEGVAWCEATLGIAPGAGGTHPLMGTHNRLVKIASMAYPHAFLEIIATDPAAIHQRPAGCKRWFDMDDTALLARLHRTGPQLAHFVAQTSDIDLAVMALARLGIDRGQALPVSRLTKQGLLRWRISVRDDGQRLFDGNLPTLIQWDGVLPVHTMADSGITLESLHITHPQANLLTAACQTIGLSGVSIEHGPAQIQARLNTPRGLLNITS